MVDVAFIMFQSLFNVREALMKMRSYEQAKGTKFVFDGEEAPL